MWVSCSTCGERSRPRPDVSIDIRGRMFAREALYIPAHWHKQVHFFGGAGAGTRCKCLNGAVDFWYRPLTTDKQSAVAAAKSLKEEL